MPINKKKYLNLFLWVGLLIIAIAILYSFSIDLMYKNKNDGALVGDSFGALNAIFSGLAFAGVILTVVMQRDELTLQRKELKDTRKEFQMNRATNVIYEQLRKFESEMSTFEYVDSNGSVIKKGTNGILALNSLVKIKPTENGNQYNGMDEGRRAWLIRQIQSLIHNRNSLLILTSGLMPSLSIVNEICSQEDFIEDEKTKLKSLFYSNISRLHTYAFRGMLSQIEEFDSKIYEYNDFHTWNFNQGQFDYLKKSVNFLKLLIDNLDELAPEN